MKIWFPLVLAALALIACGEESETVRVTERYTLDMLGKGVSLTEELCDSARMGQLLYVGDSSSIYYCTGKVWKRANGVNGKDGRDGKDGVDGVDGKKGKYGESGTDCFIDQFADGFSLGCGSTKAVIRFNFEIPDTCRIALRSDSSYVLTCCKDSVELLQGVQGDAGDICRQTDIGGGKVRLVCGNDSVTTYKAQCGETPFDPDGSQFCYGDSLVERCGKHAYDIKKQFCYEDSLVDMCEDDVYDPTLYFCYGDSLVYLCGGHAYDLKEQFCSNDSLVALCNGKRYDLDKLVCEDNVLYDECAGVRFNVDRYFCYKDSLVYLCEGSDYDLKKYFCYNDSLIKLCGGKSYNPNELVCKTDSLYGDCAGNHYNIDRQFCDERDGGIYGYTVIGGMTWMSQNLDFRMPNSFCDSLFKDKYWRCGIKGRFYLWSAAMDLPESECGYGRSCAAAIQYPHQGACPKGWHLPTIEEWRALRDVMGPNDVAYWDKSVVLHDRENPPELMDEFGFSAIPTGTVRVDRKNGEFVRMDSATIFPDGFDAWSSSEADAEKAELCFFYANNTYEGAVKLEHPYYKNVTRTVRCVKDVTP